MRAGRLNRRITIQARTDSQNTTGETVWTTQLDDHPAAIITQSATVFAGVVYVGVSSLEEAYAAFIPGYPCCTFRGSMAALDLKTDRQRRKVLMQQWTWLGPRTAPRKELKRRIEEELGRFEKFQLGE